MKSFLIEMSDPICTESRGCLFLYGKQTSGIQAVINNKKQINFKTWLSLVLIL